MPGELSFVPNPLNFGTIIAGATSDLVIDVGNVGDERLQIDDLTSDTSEFTVVTPVTPQFIEPQTQIQVTIRYSPLVAGSDSGNLTAFSNAINSPTVLPVLGSAVASGGALQADPSQWPFGEIKENTLSAEKLFNIRNEGDAAVTLNSASVATGFSLTTNPTPVVLNPGDDADFGVKFAPVDSIFYYSAAGLSIVNTSAVNPFNIPLSGLGVPITSVFPVEDLEETVLIGITDVAGVSSSRTVNPLEGCEEICTAQKLFDFWFPDADFPIRGYEKTTFRIEIYYEDLGDFEIRATLIGKRDIISTQQLSITGNQDERVKTAIFDLKCTDELQQLTLVLTEGRCSIVLILFSLQPGAETVKGT